MKLLFGTTNQAKLSAMKSRLEKIGVELIGLNDLKAEGKRIPEVLENGDSPLENAKLKAVAYYAAFKIPCFSCDSGLYFENVPDEIQPGVHVRNVNGKCLSDEEMVEYYTALTKQYDAARIFIEQKKLQPWTHNKAIQKAIESRAILAERKEYLRKLKI